VTLLASSAGYFAHTRIVVTLQTWFPFLASLQGYLVRNALFPGSIVAVGLIYYFAPNTRVRLRDVWFGAILAAVLWQLALEGFSWYLRNVSSFSVHGSIGAVVAFLVWVYLSAVILLYGVEVTASYAKVRREMRLQRLAPPEGPSGPSDGAPGPSGGAPGLPGGAPGL
jgi:YihY family inner membrane protein